MTGEELLQLLLLLTPEQRQLEVVAEGGEGWLYGAAALRICKELNGREDDRRGTPAIVITNNL